MNTCARIFFRLYPAALKPANTPEGLHLRKVVKWMLICHILFTFASFAFAIIFATMTGIIYSVWVYSVYLTLREWQVILYLLTLIFGIIYGIFNIFDEPAETLFFYILNIVFLCFAVYFVWMAYKAFRTSGGIYGGKSREERAKEKGAKEKSLKQ